VPWLLDSSDLIYGRRSRPLPGQDRRGEPVRPVQRRAMPPADLRAAREAARAARAGQSMRTTTKTTADKTASGKSAAKKEEVGAVAGKSSATTPASKPTKQG